MPASGIGGPCDHCGIGASCCWRRGPSSKPVLCNACGSRYLVKKSLDGYIPIQQRLGTLPRSSPKSTKSKVRNANLSNPSGIHKSKRAASKRHDTATWYTDSYDSEDSELAYLTDSSAGRHSSGHSDDAAAAVNHKVRSRSLLGDGARTDKVVRITNEVQLRQLCSEAVVAKLLGPSLRLKPRKPLNPSISVVFWFFAPNSQPLQTHAVEAFYESKRRFVLFFVICQFHVYYLHLYVAVLFHGQFMPPWSLFWFINTTKLHFFFVAAA